MEIRFKTLQLVNFKSHRNLTLDYEKETTHLIGPNGVGKTTTGDAVSYLTYGCDLSGSEMTKELSPEPVGYEGDTLVHLLFIVDGSSQTISKRIEQGTVKYYINDVPKKATEYKDYIQETFGDKQTFLSLYSSRYFFTLKWDEQREIIMSNILSPAKTEVLSKMEEIEAAALDKQLMKTDIDSVESTFKDKQKRSKKEYEDLKERVKTLQGVIGADSGVRPVEDIQTELEAVSESLSGAEKPETSRMDELKREILRMESEAKVLNATAAKKRTMFGAIKENPPSDTCHSCGQGIEGEAYKTSFSNWRKQLVEIKEEVNKLVSDRGLLFEQQAEFLEECRVLEANVKIPTAYNDLLVKKSELTSELKESERYASLQKQLTEAEVKEEEAGNTYRLSVLILDAIKKYRAIEAELMAEKASSLFSEGITLKLFTVNKTDGKQKPHFEIMKDGKPYRKLSLGEKMGIELELVDVLSEKIYGHAFPCFIDNSESYTGEINADGKQLIVSRAMRVEPKRSVTL